TVSLNPTAHRSRARTNHYLNLSSSAVRKIQPAESNVLTVVGNLLHVRSGRGIVYAHRILAWREVLCCKISRSVNRDALEAPYHHLTRWDKVYAQPRQPLRIDPLSRDMSRQVHRRRKRQNDTAQIAGRYIDILPGQQPEPTVPVRSRFSRCVGPDQPKRVVPGQHSFHFECAILRHTAARPEHIGIQRAVRRQKNRRMPNCAVGLPNATANLISGCPSQ